MNNRIAALIALLLSAGLFFSYINPLWTKDIADTKAAIESDNQALEEAQKYLARQQALKAESEAINADSLGKLAILLPDSVDNVGLVLSLNALAARHGFAITSIDVSSNSANTAAQAQAGANASAVGSVDLTLSATGSYSAFRSFLTGLERSQRLLDVKDLKVTGTNTGSYTYQMTLRIYWLR